MIIYPAIDIMNGKCVRLMQGDFSTQKVYAENPVEMALSFQQAGLKIFTSLIWTEPNKAVLNIGMLSKPSRVKLNFK